MGLSRPVQSCNTSFLSVIVAQSNFPWLKNCGNRVTANNHFIYLAFKMTYFTYTDKIESISMALHPLRLV